MPLSMVGPTILIDKRATSLKDTHDVISTLFLLQHASETERRLNTKSTSRVPLQNTRDYLNLSIISSHSNNSPKSHTHYTRINTSVHTCQDQSQCPQTQTKKKNNRPWSVLISRYVTHPHPHPSPRSHPTNKHHSTSKARPHQP